MCPELHVLLKTGGVVNNSKPRNLIIVLDLQGTLLSQIVKQCTEPVQDVEAASAEMPELSENKTLQNMKYMSTML